MVPVLPITVIVKGWPTYSEVDETMTLSTLFALASIVSKMENVLACVAAAPTSVAVPGAVAYTLSVKIVVAELPVFARSTQT
jgi:hypothetical protein